MRDSRRQFIRKIGLGVLGSALLPACGRDGGDDDDTPQTPLLFGFATDMHYSDKDTVGSRVYRDSDEKAADFIDECNAQGVDFIIETGDFIDRVGGESESVTLANLQTIEGVLQGYAGARYHTLGNHDMDNLSKSQVLSNVTNTGIDPASAYYSFDVKGVHFIVLDATYKSDGTEYDHGNYVWTDANIPQAELDWLTADLSGATSPAIVFCHQLLDGDGTESVVVNNAPAVRTILENSGRAVAVLAGHHHPGEYSLINGIHYYALKGMVENSYPSNNAFAIVEVIAGDRIVLDGFVNVADEDLLI